MEVNILDAVSLEVKLVELRNVLSSISKLPVSNQYYYFTGFGVSEDDIDLYGTVDAAVNHSLEVIFGNRVNGIKLLECGPELVNIVDVLRKYNTQFPRHAVLQKWVTDLIDAGLRYGGSTSTSAAPIDPQVTTSTSTVRGEKRKEPVQDGTEPNQRKKLHTEADAEPISWYIDLSLEEEAASKGKGGRGPDAILEKVRVFCYLRGDNERQKWARCIGASQGCTYKLLAAHSYRQRFFKHVSGCRFVSNDLRSEVNSSLGNQALGNITSAPLASSKSVGTLEQWTQSAGRTHLDNNINLAILKLLCVCGIPPTVVDSDEWRSLMGITSPKYRPLSSKTFVDTLIPQEAAHIQDKQVEILKKCKGLTISFDGNTTRGQQSIYTIHIITPDRRVFLYDADEASDASHTASHISSVLFKAMERICPLNFCGITSDNTGNTLNARLLIRDKYPWMIIMPDVCHMLNLLCRDIAKDPHFKPTVKSIQRAVQFFRKSTRATARLKQLRKTYGISKGIQSIGKTRFGTVYHAACSIEANFQAISDLTREKVITVPEVNSLFVPGSFSGASFQHALKQLTTVLAPVVKAITCLESTHATVSDVYVFWLAVAAEMYRLIQQDGLQMDIKEQLRRAVNYRFNRMLNEAPSDVYICGFILDPRYRNASILKDMNPLSAGTIKLPAQNKTSKEASSSELPVPLRR